MRRILASAIVLLLAGCAKEMTEKNVREFVDDADHAYLAGHAADICSMRSDDFKFTGSLFKLAEGRVVNDLQEAMRVDDEQNRSGRRVTAQVVSINAQDYCRMAIEQRALYRRVSLVRTDLQITIAPDKKSATVRAHYVEKAPQYGYSEGAMSYQDQTEHQLGTLQTESDDESVVTLNRDGKFVFSSTRATSKQFRVPKERDSRL
jgi:hypothetical protein